MKKILLLAAVVLASSSCSKNTEQIRISKAKLLELQVSEKELEKYDFEVTELVDRDVYGIISDYYMDQVKSYQGFPDMQRHYLNKASENMTVMEDLKAKGELEGKRTFYRVHALRIAGDTLNDKTFFLDNKNNIVFLINKR